MSTHKMKFGNLVEPQTREPIVLEVPDDLVYEGRAIVAETLGGQSAKRALAHIQASDPDEEF